MARPPAESADQSDRVLFWDSLRSRPTYIQTGGNVREQWFNYSTNAWVDIDNYQPFSLNQEIYATWDGKSNKALVAAALTTTTFQTVWYLYDPGLTGSAAWTNLTLSVPAGFTTWCTSTTPCFNSSMTYDATNQLSIVMTQTGANWTPTLWAYDSQANTWSSVSVTGAPSSDPGSLPWRNAYPAHLWYDSGTTSLFYMDVRANSNVETWKIQLAINTPVPTGTFTITPTPSPTPTPTGVACTKYVGSSRTYTLPSQAAAAAVDGDVICIDKATYTDVTRWYQNNLTVVGCDGAGHCPGWTRASSLTVNDWPVLDAGGVSSGGRGLWDVSGNNFAAATLEFRCATAWISNPHCSAYVPGNDVQAGIRHQGHGGGGHNDAGVGGHGLTVRNSYFHDNDDGILGSEDTCVQPTCVGGTNAGSACTLNSDCNSNVCVPLDCIVDADCPVGTCAHGTVLIERTEFYRNGNPTFNGGSTHNLYIGRAQHLTFQDNYSHAAVMGHLIKTRARSNSILFNRLTDEVPDSAGCPSNGLGPSQEADVPEGGLTYFIGNIMEKAHGACESGYFVKYGWDGASNQPTGTNNTPVEIYMVNNTLVSDCGPDLTCGGGNAGRFWQIGAGASVWTYNEIPWAGNAAALWVINMSNQPLTTGFTQSNNLGVNTNPVLVNQSGYEYHLQGSSPAINAGIDPGTDSHGYSLLPTQEYVYDLALATRPIFGSAPEIGAFEYEVGPTATPSATPTATATPHGHRRPTPLRIVP